MANRHPLYITWIGIKARCFNTNDPRYDKYGGAGITMQDSWVHNFVAFAEYVSSLPRYYERKKFNLTLDRENNAGNYTEGNLRWATPKEQANNRHYTPKEKYVGKNQHRDEARKKAALARLGL